MTKPTTFTFVDYSFDKKQKTASFNYAYKELDIFFTETYTFDFDYISYDKNALDIALKHLFIMAGISYYKAFLPKDIEVDMPLTQNEASFFRDTYQKGLRELFYKNNLPIDTPVEFESSTNNDISINLQNNKGYLVGIGGGKDSLVSLAMLQKENAQPIATWSLGHQHKLQNLITSLQTNHFFVNRKVDSKIIELNNNSALNGHIPISAIIACAGTVVNILSGYKNHIVSNESSANEATVTINGLPVNHQYSKSAEFENSYQKLLSLTYNNSLTYSSKLRNLNELQITEYFVKSGTFNKYKDVFCSCNNAFTGKYDKLFWCGECPKCAFVYGALSMYISQIELKNLFGSNPLINQDNITIYKDLLGQTKTKPFDCVGTIYESQIIMRNAYKLYPEIQKVYGKI